MTKRESSGCVCHRLAGQNHPCRCFPVLLVAHCGRAGHSVRTRNASQLLDRFQAEAQVHPFRTAQDGARSYALSSDTVQLDDIDALLDRLAEDWREHLAPPS